MPPAIMDPKIRVKQACDRCRVKKIKVSTVFLLRLSLMLTLVLCDGENLCERCLAENSVCNYEGADLRQNRTSQ